MISFMFSLSVTNLPVELHIQNIQNTDVFCLTKTLFEQVIKSIIVNGYTWLTFSQFDKGGDFSRFLFVFIYTRPILKGSTLNGKNWLLHVSQTDIT